MMRKNEEEEVFLDESDDSLDALGKAEAKLKKLKQELEVCKSERQEYLDGWQRMRADAANQKKEAADMFSRAKFAAIEDFLEDMLPALDAFDMAMQGDGWQEVSAAWRSGVEYIYTQMISALDKHGVTAYGAPGEAFNASEYEAMDEIAADAPSHTVVKVLRRGYKIGSRVLRPAQVIVAK